MEKWRADTTVRHVNPWLPHTNVHLLDTFPPYDFEPRVDCLAANAAAVPIVDEVAAVTVGSPASFA